MTACGEGVAPMRCLGLMALGCGKTFGGGDFSRFMRFMVEDGFKIRFRFWCDVCVEIRP
jgi:hypothetical protein